MPTGILNAAPMLRIRPNDGILFFKPTVENLDNTISKSCNESLVGVVVRADRSDRAVRVGIQILDTVLSRKSSGRKDSLYQALRFSLSVPNFDNPRVASHQECPSSLPPVDNHTSSLSDRNNFVQCPESADHLELLLKGRVIIAVQPHDTVS